jgi:hypothetical protein
MHDASSHPNTSSSCCCLTQATHAPSARCFLKKSVSRSHAAAATPSSYGTKSLHRAVAGAQTAQLARLQAQHRAAATVTAVAMVAMAQQLRLPVRTPSQTVVMRVRQRAERNRNAPRMAANKVFVPYQHVVRKSAPAAADQPAADCGNDGSMPASRSASSSSRATRASASASPPARSSATLVRPAGA